MTGPDVAPTREQPVSLLRTGGAGQKGGFQNIEEDLWNATKDEVSMDMPEAHEAAERGQMAQDGLAGASPADQTTFPSNREDQARLRSFAVLRSSGATWAHLSWGLYILLKSQTQPGLIHPWAAVGSLEVSETARVHSSWGIIFS